MKINEDPRKSFIVNMVIIRNKDSELPMYYAEFSSSDKVLWATIPNDRIKVWLSKNERDLKDTKRKLVKLGFNIEVVELASVKQV
jgi:hypothetical protein